MSNITHVIPSTSSSTYATLCRVTCAAPNPPEWHYWMRMGVTLEEYGGWIADGLVLSIGIPVAVRGAMIERYHAHIEGLRAAQRLRTPGERAIFCYLLAHESADEASP